MHYSTASMAAIFAASFASGLVIPSVDSRQEPGPAVQLSERAFESKIFYAKSQGVPHKYIVVLKNEADVQKTVKEVTNAHTAYTRSRMSVSSVGAKLDVSTHFNIGDSFKGFVAEIGPEYVQELAKHGEVVRVEQNSIARAAEATNQENAPWGLARISSKDTLSAQATNRTYFYDSEGGEGVTAYVVDSGIQINNTNFEGRASWGTTFVDDAEFDGAGHGTHCAGVIASRDFGVAKKAKLVAVRVLDNDAQGTWANVIKGLEWVVEEHKKNVGKPGYKGSTVNFSIGGTSERPTNDTMAANEASAAVVASGLHLVISAGNNNVDACTKVPQAPTAITVGATNNADTRAEFSNFGACVDVFAPGVEVLSTYIGSTNATALLSGTPMATPHVTGLVTYFLSLMPSSGSGFSSSALITPAQMKKAIINFGTRDKVQDAGANSPNVIVYNGAGGDLSEFWAHF